MTKHTPEPWRKDEVLLHRADGSTELLSSTVYAGKTRVAVVDDERDHDLIAAAPDLLACLKSLVAQVLEYEQVNHLSPNPGRGYCWDATAAAVGAISKAEGWA